MNCAALLHQAIHSRPDATALLQDAVTVTFGALDARTNQVANALRELGLGQGDVVAILVRNDYRYVEAVFGALRAGCTVVPVTTRSVYHTLAHVIADSEAKLLIASSEFAEQAHQLRSEIGTLGHLRLMDVHNTDTPNVSYDTWRNEAADTPLFVDVTDRDIAMLCYTSGSTGVPKGVPLTHGGISWCARTMRKAMLLGPEHRCLLAVPLFHANATTCGLWPMLEGGGSVVIQRDFDTAAVLRGLSEHGCTYTTGVPAMYKLMLRERELIESLDFPALQFVLCSSSEVPEALLREFEEVFGVPMIEGYGITEGGPMVLSNPRWGATKPGTSGIPLPGVELRISDREDPTIDAAQGEIGELLVRSPGVTPAYHNLPELSAERLLDGGWLRTRDLVRRDEQGYVKVVGRVDDMIICGGENIYPTEIENRLIAHPDVSDVAVVSRADEIKSQVPVAFVVAKAGTTINAEVIKQYALDTGPAYQHPRAVYLIDELPLTAAKKVDRSQLTQLAQAKANAMANL